MAKTTKKPVAKKPVKKPVAKKPVKKPVAKKPSNVATSGRYKKKGTV